MNKEYEPLGASENRPDWFYPEWAADAPNNQPIVGKDTDSALGRYNLQTKEIGLKDIARIHGHMCDGLVIAFVEIKAKCFLMAWSTEPISRLFQKMGLVGPMRRRF